MMSIDAVTFDNDLQWVDEFKYPNTTGKADRTIFGSMVTQSFTLTGGRVVTLVGTPESGWLKRSTVEALIALAAIPGATYTLTIGVRTLTVTFRHEESPAVEFEPLLLMGDTPTGNEWYTGTIKLREV